MSGLRRWASSRARQLEPEVPTGHAAGSIRFPGALIGVLHPYLLFLVAALAVWWPDGYNIGPVTDAWLKLDYAVPASPLAFYNFKSAEIFTLWPYAHSVILSAGGFQVCQVALLAFTVMRAALWYEIVKRLFPENPPFAVACGLTALFHPFDEGIFWLGALGVHLALVWALAYCVAALEHLRSGSRVSLAGMFVLQIIYCLNYPAFLLIIVALPVGAWILRRIAGFRDPLGYIIKIGIPVFIFIGLQLLLATRGVGREGKVIDLDLHEVWAGYVYAGSHVAKAAVQFFTECKLAYLAAAFIPAVLAYLALVVGAIGPAPLREPGRSRTFYWVSAGGLLVLALLSYLPYALSTDRFDDTRQFLAAGIFVSALLLLLPCVALRKYFQSRHAAGALLAVVMVGTVISGLEGRKQWVDDYRAQEGLLASIAALLPHPAAGSFIVVNLEDKSQPHELAGFYNRHQTLEGALHMMYDDPSLHAAFTEFGEAPFTFGKDGVAINSHNPENQGLSAPYGSLILIDYSGSRQARLLDRQWLAQFAPKGISFGNRNLGHYDAAPSSGAIICTLLEKDYRPAYCR